MSTLKRVNKPRNGIAFIHSSELREELTPFVFLDSGSMERSDDGFTVPFHPHSGIGIITYFLGGDLHHKDSTQGNDGVIPGGGVQWMSAGGGIWHEESYRKSPANDAIKWPLSIYQLWMQLPPDLEEGDPEYTNLNPGEIPEQDGSRVISGKLGSVQGRINTPFNLTFTDTALGKDDKFRFALPAGLNSTFILPRRGVVSIDGTKIEPWDMGIIEADAAGIEVTSESESSEFIFVSSPRAEYKAIARGGSFHTNEDSMNQSMKKIRNIGTERRLG
jgi:redox-sensitive bicupin YhaK (pirin superfamily)